MSYPPHLIKVNKCFYYKAKVPVDLQYYFPCTFIKRSLKTTDLREAKTMLTAMEYNIHRCFTLLRTGMLSDDIIIQVVKKIMPSRGKVVGEGQDIAITSNMMLPEVIKRYVAEKQAGWTEKTKMEVSSVFRLLEDIIGSIDVSTITKPMIVELRSTLQKLPPNIYKKYPGKGAESSQKSGHALEEILNRINEVTMQINQIATAAEQQTATTTEVTNNIQQVTEIVHQSARGAEETASAASQLSVQAQQLQNLVGKFRIS